ncbi:extracellular solute-binding protein family 5 [Xylanimonas cellulosilytica DSM 15894]|uniref:Extracellular solute-binding protein family 5 n=1 Tax=Xylanimonas cellulosilytica (strain DSM 15894 / JCM 12276 / CECT 5975 / KCTC 9989 / LMG 20990 / NBRC 107835 / XIL07) TaxID=446471 RepID=D1C0F0_XYLCX|nr:ABC transporter substrate-binding protein [Xylanimonas cellulosilytica]ACZ32153.1 extracellular solute-binding protein family 5 [Xylanimonas cellulosilytica DSM 15894]
MSVRRPTVVVALLALTMLLTGCNAGSTAVHPSAGPGGGIRTDVTVAVAAEPVNLDFRVTSGAAIPQLLMNNVYETLVKIDQDGAVVPLLAERWDVSDDRTQYTFHLREGVTFSDGSTFDADDVVASFDRVRTDWLNAIKVKMDVVESTVALDERTVRVTLTQPSNAWLADLGTSVGAVFPSDLDGVDLRTTAIGTGPYEVFSVRQGDRIVLAGRPDHWGGPAAMTTITVRYLADPTSAVNALRAGDVDLLFNSATGDQVRQLEARGGFQVVEGTSTGDVLLSFNNRVPPFDDVRVRRAFAYAIDRQAVMATASAGYGTQVVAMVTPQDPYFEDLTGVYPYDPDRARVLLAEARASDLQVTFDVPNLAYATTAAELIASQLAEVGVRVRLVTDEFPAVWLDKVFTRHDFQMSVIQHSEARDLLTVFRPDYYLGYDDTVIAPLAAAADAGTPQEYVDGMRQVARQVVDDAGGIVLYLAPTLIVADEALTGIRPNAVTESMDLTQLAWR